MAGKIIEKTGGEKVYLGNDEMILNLSKYERDDPVHIDIGLNARGFMTFGVSDRYAVQIDIPDREYELEETGEQDENGTPRMRKKARAFSMDRVTITLWGRAAEPEEKEGGADNA